MPKTCICGQCGVVTHETIKLSGPRTTTLYVDNPTKREVQRWQVDGCQITAGRRCDWLLCVDDAAGTREIFVELKKSDFAGALEQLEETLLQGFRCCNRSSQPNCVVALRRNPMAGTDVALAKDRFKRKYGARLETRHDGGTFKLAP